MLQVGILFLSKELVIRCSPAREGRRGVYNTCLYALDIRVARVSLSIKQYIHSFRELTVHACTCVLCVRDRSTCQDTCSCMRTLTQNS
jgi:hypothetical protein